MTNILVVGPHPDDQEAGMGGAIALFAAQGHSVLLLDVTNGEPTPLGSPESRAREADAAAAALSAPENAVKRRLLGLPNRFVEHSIDARHAVAGVIREHKAEILFAPFFEDAHPDHRAVTRIVEDARFDAKLSRIDLPGEPTYPRWLFYYYATHLRWVANPTFCIDISAHMEQKISAIQAYETQFVKTNANVVDWIRASATYMGSRIGAKSAEPFYTKEPLALTSLAGVLMTATKQTPKPTSP